MASILLMNTVLRICKCCGIEKPFEEFASANSLKGVIYRRWSCVKCYSKQKRREQRAHVDWFDGYKQTCKCAHCGNTDHRTLQFHHRDPSDKEDDVCMLVGRKNSRERVLAEVAKCDCLCANCHSILHHEERKLNRCVAQSGQSTAFGTQGSGGSNPLTPTNS